MGKKPDTDTDLPESLPGIDLESALIRVGGNKKLLRELLIAFRKKYAAAADEIEKLIAQKNFKGAERTAHTIRGIAGNISAGLIQAAAQKLEEALADNNTDDYQSLLSDLDHAIQQVLNSTRNMDRTGTKKLLPEGTSPDLSIIGSILKEMAQRLSKFDADAEQSLEKLKSHVGSSWLHEDMEDLDDYITVFDFENGLQVLRKIAGKLNISLEE